MRPVLYTGDIFRLQARGGITRYFIEVMNRLERRARVVAGIHQSAEIAAVTVPVSAAVRIPAFKGGPRLRAAANRIADALWLRDRGGAIVHPTYYRDPARLPGGHPVVVTVFDMAHERLDALFRRRWWNAPDPAEFKRALCLHADRIVCISESTRRDLVELIPVEPARVRVIHCGATRWDEIAAAPVPQAGERFLIWVGERRGYKNFLETLAAWAQCRDAAGTRLLCVGGGPFRREESERAQALGVMNRLIQRDASDAELKWAYANAAGLVYTSRFEGFGLPVLEALALGCPVVASDLDALREVAADQAIYVDPNDRASLAAGIARCLAQPRSESSTCAMGSRAAAFSWDACAASHEALYRELD